MCAHGTRPFTMCVMSVHGTQCTHGTRPFTMCVMSVHGTQCTHGTRPFTMCVMSVHGTQCTHGTRPFTMCVMSVHGTHISPQGNEIIQKLQNELRSMKSKVRLYKHVHVYRIAGNIGGNYIWWIARKSSEIKIGRF